MSRTGLRAATIGAALVLAACGAVGTNPSAATTTHPTATATPAPTPTPDVRAIAAQQYLATVTAYNKANDSFNAAEAKLPGTAPWSATVPPARALYKAETAETQAVFAIQFPPDMATDVSALVSAFNTEQERMLAVISSPNQSTWTDWDTAATASGSASNAVRRDLGLAPVPLGTPAP